MFNDVLKENMNNSLELDDLFETTESKLTKEKVGETREIKLCDLHEFKDHPFKVLDNDDMEELKQSIALNGLLMPIIVRELKDNYYEILSGHRRKKACELLGIESVTCLVRDFNDEQSTVLMVDSNLQRDVILPSEKAFAYKMKLNAIKKNVGRKTNTNQTDTNLRSDEEIASNSEDSARQIQRYVRLTYLEKDLLEMVDTRKVPFNVAVELSYLNEDDQIMLMLKMEELEVVPSIAQASKLKKYASESELTETLIDSILTESKPKAIQVTLKKDKLSKYFDKGESQEDIEKTIIKLLEDWKGG